MPLADELINEGTARALTTAIRAQLPKSRLTALRAAGTAMAPLPLRARSDLLRDALLADIPGDFATLATVVRAALHGTATFDGWMIWPVSTAVAQRAARQNDPAAFDDAMALLAELTGRLSAEFAIRTLLKQDLARALAITMTWAASDDAAVRRLASEGTRPYLPWAIRVPQLIARPDCTVPILDALYRDDDEVVRRSVANHLNDLSRENAGLVVEVAGRWLADPDHNTQALVRHALRTLVKRGDPAALELLGFPAVTVTVGAPVVDRAMMVLGERLTFSTTISNDGTQPARVVIDYAVHHLKANGTSVPKVFKLTTRTLAPGESVIISKDHTIRPITTRRYYPGTHAVDVRVNGIASAATPFELVMEA